MSDVVVTVPAKRWKAWLKEGDLPGTTWSGQLYEFRVHSAPAITPGERVYIVALGQLRGYAPLFCLEVRGASGIYLIRGGGAVAVTIPQPIPGFRGYRYRWWPYEAEIACPDEEIP